MGQPLRSLARVTEEVAGGATEVAVPHADRQDEVGALARSIVVFQQAIARNAELNRTIADDVKAREERDGHIRTAVESFRTSVEQALGARASETLTGEFHQGQTAGRELRQMRTPRAWIATPFAGEARSMRCWGNLAPARSTSSSARR